MPLLEALAHRGGGPASEVGIGVRFHLHLDRQVRRNPSEKLVQGQGPLGSRDAVAVEESSLGDRGGRLLVGPAVERRAERKQRIVKEHEPPVGGQADVGLEAVHTGRQGAGESLGGGVGAISATEAVCVERRRTHMNIPLNLRPPRVT